MNNFLFFLIKIYKKIFDPFIPSSCRYYPTCSNYFIYVNSKYNFLIAIFFLFKRIFSCNFFFNGGFDPSP